MTEALTAQRKIALRGAVKLDDAGEGTFRAVFSTFDVIDLDNDVTLPDAFEQGQKVRLAQWGHAWHLPTIGTGTIDFDTSKAWVDGRFNLKTDAGREHYEAVKDNGDLQEWSYGFDILKWSYGPYPEDAQNTVRFLEKLKVHEVSPVMLGAGIDTRTETIKALDTLQSGATLERQSEIVLAAVTEFASRLKSLADLRTQNGRTLSDANRARLKAHIDALTALYEATATRPKGIDPRQLRGIVAAAEAELATQGIFIG